jgi:hypothetical protein
MGYTIRFIGLGGCPITLSSLAEQCRWLDLVLTSSEGANGANVDRTMQLEQDGEVYAQLRLLYHGSDYFEDEITELLELLEESSGDSEGDMDMVRDVLHNAQFVLTAHPLHEGLHEDMLQPIWDWLFATCRGLLQVDGEGYYDSSGLILEDYA